MSFQWFKNDYDTSNKELLSKVKPNLHHAMSAMMLSAYTKFHDKLRYSNYNEENKGEINRRHREFYEQNKAKLQLKQNIKFEEYKPRSMINAKK